MSSCDPIEFVEMQEYLAEPPQHEACSPSLRLWYIPIDRVHSAFDKWINGNAHLTLHTLSISIPYFRNCRESPHALPSYLLHHEQSEEYFEPIRSLELENTYLTWGGTVFHNLVELRLSFLTDNICPTVNQFVAILMSSPSLRTLWLRQMTILPSEDYGCPPVQLDYLETLGLEYIHPRGLGLLLPLLAPETLPLSVTFALNSRYLEDSEASLINFLAGPRVVGLCLGSPLDPAQQLRIFAQLQHLRSLTWQGVHIKSFFFYSLIHDSSIEPCEAEPRYLCPNLDELVLQGCSFSAIALQDMATNRVLARLTIVECHLNVNGSNEEISEITDHFEGSLKDTVLELVLSRNSWGNRDEEVIQERGRGQKEKVKGGGGGDGGGKGGGKRGDKGKWKRKGKGR